VVAWGSRAEVIEKYVTKGMQVYIEGKSRTRKYTDKENIERYVTEINCEVIQMLGSKSGVKQEPADKSPLPDNELNPPEGTDDLPF
jgi:single-strand DNA-binding protein